MHRLCLIRVGVEVLQRSAGRDHAGDVLFYTVLLGVVISSLAQRLIPDALRGAGEQRQPALRPDWPDRRRAARRDPGPGIRARRPVLGGRRPAGPDCAGTPPVHDPGNAVSTPPEAPPPPVTLMGAVPFGEPQVFEGLIDWINRHGPTIAADG